MLRIAITTGILALVSPIFAQGSFSPFFRPASAPQEERTRGPRVAHSEMQVGDLVRVQGAKILEVIDGQSAIVELFPWDDLNVSNVVCLKIPTAGMVDTKKIQVNKVFRVTGTEAFMNVNRKRTLLVLEQPQPQAKKPTAKPEKKPSKATG